MSTGADSTRASTPDSTSAPHAALRALLGRWRGEEEIAASPWSPETTAEAELELRETAGGVAVAQEYRHRRADGGEFALHGIFAADAASGDIFWYAVDSYGSPPEAPARGGWSGSTLTMVKTTPRGEARHRFTVDGDRLSYEIDTRMGDATGFSAFLRGRYRREG